MGTQSKLSDEAVVLNKISVHAYMNFCSTYCIMRRQTFCYRHVLGDYKVQRIPEDSFLASFDLLDTYNVNAQWNICYLKEWNVFLFIQINFSHYGKGKLFSEPTTCISCWCYTYSFCIYKIQSVLWKTKCKRMDASSSFDDVDEFLSCKILNIRSRVGNLSKSNHLRFRLN